MKLLLATRNRGKVREMEALFSDIPIEPVSIPDPAFDIEETGSSFEENAVLKAEGCGKRFGMLSLGDDSGLQVDSLGGRPGIYSARYASGDEERCRKLLAEMEGAEDRRARFVCCACLYSPDADLIRELKNAAGENGDYVFYRNDPRIITVKAFLEGEIAFEPGGSNGFGFDPVLYAPCLGCRLAEASPEEKNAVSHRGKAMRKIKELLRIAAEREMI